MEIFGRANVIHYVTTATYVGISDWSYRNGESKNTDRASRLDASDELKKENDRNMAVGLQAELWWWMRVGEPGQH